MQVCQANTPAQIAAIRELFHEYSASLSIDLCFQGFVEEMANLPGFYAPPRGRLLLATDGGSSAGCVAIRPIGAMVCEMKRLYVKPDYRRRGLGRTLAQQAISDAGRIGYSTMALDTLPTMLSAIRLYESLGFGKCSAYYDTPLQETVFMELRLQACRYVQPE